jgi:hypothetical protein
MEDGPFRYHLELTPEQLKITHTALRSLLDDFGHDQGEIHKIIHELLAKLPDEHAIRAIRIGEGERGGDIVELDSRGDDGRDGGEDPSAA